VSEAQAITDVLCVQNYYNLVYRPDDALIDDLARQRIAYVPFFPLGGFTPLQSSTLSSAAGRLGGHADAGRAGLANSALAQHSADSWYILRRTNASFMSI
jgi:aryl-alcohol dehydrogenase-like predicted oxidoreductase